MSDKKELSESELDAVSGGAQQVRPEEDAKLAANPSMRKVPTPGAVHRAKGQEQFMAKPKARVELKAKPRAAQPKKTASFQKLKR